jgi:hypothetical protein
MHMLFFRHSAEIVATPAVFPAASLVNQDAVMICGTSESLGFLKYCGAGESKCES